ncbi:transcription factor SPN1, partial [Tremellales sp. Uapishka_1]
MSASPPPPEATLEATQEQGTQNALYNQIFGGDGEDSDLSEDEDERPTGRLAFPPRQAARSESGTPAGDQSENDDDDEDEDRDVYVPATESSAAKIPKFKKVRKEADGGEKEVRKKKKRSEGAKPKRREREPRAEVAADDDDDDVAPVYDEATQRRMALEERIDNIGKKARVVRRKKKGEDEGDEVDSLHDEICARLRDRMLNAADRDEASNKAKMPATSKLAMLDEVMSVLRNTTMWSSIVDAGVLEAVKRWLEPLPDRSLPGVGIQKAIFEVLPKMHLDTQTLKESRLGPIVLFYTKTKRVTPSITRQADALIQEWSRPIIKRPADFRSRYIPDSQQAEADEDNEGGEARVRKVSKVKRFDVKEALRDNVGRKGARPPIAKEVQYTVAPESKLHHHAEDLQYVSRVQTDNKKFNKFARQIRGGGRGGR